jgi:hypothetical protein
VLRRGGCALGFPYQEFNNAITFTAILRGERGGAGQETRRIRARSREKKRDGVHEQKPSVPSRASKVGVSTQKEVSIPGSPPLHLPTLLHLPQDALSTTQALRKPLPLPPTGGSSLVAFYFPGLPAKLHKTDEDCEAICGAAVFDDITKRDKSRPLTPWL